MQLEGRVALVTGGARGIGAETCRVLAERGARVVVADVDKEAADEVVAAINAAAPGGLVVAHGVACDVTDREQVERAVAAAVEQFGGLDVLVTCAGVTRDNYLFKMSDQDWHDVIATHLTGTFLCARAAQSVMTRARYGKMVFLSSTAALGTAGQANYAAAKAGLQGMAKTLALELGKFNVNVNAVAPGFVDTQMTRASAQRLGRDWDEYAAERAELYALKRIGKPRDIATIVAFLCSDDSSFVTGQVIYASGTPRA